jgi:hypothetical protein
VETCRGARRHNPTLSFVSEQAQGLLSWNASFQNWKDVACRVGFPALVAVSEPEVAPQYRNSSIPVAPY